jgi:phage tail-like protein
MSEENSQWPIATFHFSISINGQQCSFQEVSGLETETQIIEYRHGNSKEFAPIKMPGLKKVGNVTLKKGVFQKDTFFWQWYSKIQMNTIERSTVVINLLDVSRNSIMTWTLNNAFPVKVTGSELNAEGNEVAIESVEIAYETLVISNG